MQPVDLRSDTMTRPTPEMRKAMAEAEVGDDVFSEDPTVNRLEEMAAERLGKEAAVLVASGTMGNLLALKTHTNPGEEVLLERDCHIYYYEAGGLSAVCGLTPRLIAGKNGMMSPEDVERAIRPPNVHYPRGLIL